MSYQVLARKWRPQRFDEVVGQRAITQTLRNAIKGERVAQAFVFAGPRGVGKTTTARILARALNCIKGPTGDPCGACEACVEIAEGRDIDVLEIDAATHTGIDNVREVIISGLSIPPVRNRFKIFLIDEVHQLSPQSFNALLKSIEEPPPHVVFMMATTELGKIPDTILSRVQVFEFRAISTRAIAEQLKMIAAAENVTIADDALALIARSADGSMRDAETALDQVMAFAGQTVSVEDVSTVLGLVGRDLLLDILTAVADEEAAAAFALTGRAVEAGYDLKLVCRELSRIVRDVLIISVDASRLQDADIAPEGERERLRGLASRFSREDLLRAFDVLTRAEADIRTSAEPRYHLEMALLRWIHLRKLTPIEELIDTLQRGGGVPSSPGLVKEPMRSHPPSAPVKRGIAPDGKIPALANPEAVPPLGDTPAQSVPESKTAEIRAIIDARRTVSRPTGSRPNSHAPTPDPRSPIPDPRPPIPDPRSSSPNPQSLVPDPRPPIPDPHFKDQFLAEVQKAKAVFFGTVVAQAQRIDVEGDRITFTFTPTHRAMRDQVEQNRAWLETMAVKVAGGRMLVRTAMNEQAAADEGASAESRGLASKQGDLKTAVMADAGVQALLDVFPAEIRDVEEME